MSLSTVKPGVPASTRMTDIPLCAGEAVGSVFTSTGSGSAKRALVIHVLVPLMT